MRKIRNIVIVLIILLIISSIIVIISIIQKNKEEAETSELVNEEIVKNPEFWNIQIVENANDFYTVSACVDKFLNFWYIQNNEDVYKMLEEEYITENSITEENVFEKIGTLSEMLTFRPKKMYYLNIEQSVERYYVYGTVRTETMNERGAENDYYIEVILNFNNDTFSIKPSTEKEFPDNI